MSDIERPGLRHRISAYLWRGLLVTLAPAITIWLIGLIYRLLNDFLGPIVSLLVRLIIPASWLGPFTNGDVPGLTLVLSILALIFAGWLTSGKIGDRVWHFILDSIFTRVPGVRNIYSAIRTAVDSFANPKKREFKRSVWIPTFGRGRALAIVTQESIIDPTGEKLYTIWWPHSPNPMSGMVMSFPENDLIDSGLDYQQTMEVYVSLGVKMPLSLRLVSALAKKLLTVLPAPESEDKK